MVRLRRLTGPSVLQGLGLAAAAAGLLILFGLGVTLLVSGVATVALGALAEARQ